MNELLAEQAELQEKIDAGDGWEIDRTVEIALDALRCPPADSPVTTLSGGERRRVALCRLLLEKPDMLLLDEPTNHLDAESVSWLEKTLRDYTGAVLIVTHDRYFLDNVTNWILEVDRGRGIPYQGNYSAYLEQKRKRLQQEEREESTRQRQLAEEQEWIGRSPAARMPRARPASRPMRTCWRSSSERAPGPTEIVIPPAPRLGNVVIDGGEAAQGLRQPAADRRPVLQAAAGRHRRRHRPERRRQDHAVQDDHRRRPARRRHPGGRRDACSSAMSTSRRDSLDDRQDRLAGDLRRARTRSPWASARCPAGAYCAAFNFKGADQQKPVGVLSGGERNRVHLAKMLKTRAQRAAAR